MKNFLKVLLCLTFVQIIAVVSLLTHDMKQIDAELGVLILMILDSAVIIYYLILAYIIYIGLSTSISKIRATVLVILNILPVYFTFIYADTFNISRCFPRVVLNGVQNLRSF